MGLSGKDILNHIPHRSGSLLLAVCCHLKETGSMKRRASTSCQVYKLYNDPFNLPNGISTTKLSKYTKLERIE